MITLKFESWEEFEDAIAAISMLETQLANGTKEE
jgi:hypothetical protein